MADYDMRIVTGILLADGWHGVDPGSLTIDRSASFIDINTGVPISPGGQWFGFAETITTTPDPPAEPATVTTGYTGRLENILAVRVVIPPPPPPEP